MYVFIISGLTRRHVPDAGLRAFVLMNLVRLYIYIEREIEIER